MVANIKSLIKACEEMQIPFHLVHPDNDFLSVDLAKQYYFIHCATPFNSQDTARICVDKDFTYKLLRNAIKMPPTVSFLDPEYSEFKSDQKQDSIEDITQQILEQFKLPVIVKMNSGSRRRNVYKCGSSSEIESSLKNIFNQDSKNYDRIALVQEMIEIKDEFRVVVFDQEIMLVYKKYSFIPVEDVELINKLQDFIKPIYKDFNLIYGGLDIALDVRGDLSLIEINSSPWFGPYINKNGDEKIIELFKKSLNYLKN
jgi:glutathione synthase/RimK-type ligase-like ATP-grasp enzyme